MALRAMTLVQVFPITDKMDFNGERDRAARAHWSKRRTYYI